MQQGIFVISLDFELHWGVRDHTTVTQYRDNLLGVRQAIPALLDIFSRRGVHATWATVGMLFCRTKRELVDAMPAKLPKYDDRRLSPYDALDEIGEDEAQDPFHFGSSLVDRIAETPGQELATHTFSHFYCLEAGQTVDDFDADLEAAERLASKRSTRLRSIVFPRNQYNEAYNAVLARRGIRSIRSSGPHWAFRPTDGSSPLPARAMRLADSYIPLTGRGGLPVRTMPEGLIDVPATRFLRPYNRRLRHLDGVRVRRVTSAMRRAARDGEVFHLWWHPHNFGVNLRENLSVLEAILDELESLRGKNKMESMSMLEAADHAPR
jgi:peptidoglycan/xylan/chitin deacetylase (PgdA/CDA1 family)